ncbi:hypothetical protein BO71DRAFT_393913 [Aspergillus ellipticus CBS 707.79]|uniref:AT hook motif protein n=1 Tax=Aspergillus ellipticus CBS 707.79 TaxID=1448320 RepID=A0A319DQI3_9EURO|nr:hypothetical protein BO71DRAFT_393913 [Aspergillus ellipticus CBS 707.79]
MPPHPNLNPTQVFIMPMTWNDTADAKLLIGILQTSPVKLEFAPLAEYMGPSCTVSAIQHRIQRLKEKVSAVATGTESGPATPSKKAGTAATGAETVGTPKKRGRPPKAATAGEGSSDAAGTSTPGETSAGPRKRGRPKRVKTSEEASEDTLDDIKTEVDAENDPSELKSDSGNDSKEMTDVMVKVEI